MKEIEFVKIKDLSLSRENPRTITKKKFKQLCDDIKADPTFLECRPVLVYIEDGEKIVYAGTQRVRASKHLGFTEIPCIIENKENLTEDQIRRRIIIDNMHAGEFDYEMLANEWDLNDLLILGFDPKQFDLKLEESPKKEKKPAQCPHCGKDI